MAHTSKKRFPSQLEVAAALEDQRPLPSPSSAPEHFAWAADQRFRQKV